MGQIGECDAERISCLIHDLRQPLGVISMAVENIRLRYKSAPDQVDEAYVTAKLVRILKQIERLEARFDLESSRGAVSKGLHR